MGSVGFLNNNACYFNSLPRNLFSVLCCHGIKTAHVCAWPKDAFQRLRSRSTAVIEQIRFIAHCHTDNAHRRESRGVRVRVLERTSCRIVASVRCFAGVLEKSRTLSWIGFFRSSGSSVSIDRVDKLDLEILRMRRENSGGLN